MSLSGPKLRGRSSSRVRTTTPFSSCVFAPRWADSSPCDAFASHSSHTIRIGVSSVANSRMNCRQMPHGEQGSDGRSEVTAMARMKPVKRDSSLLAAGCSKVCALRRAVRSAQMPAPVRSLVRVRPIPAKGLRQPFLALTHRNLHSRHWRLVQFGRHSTAKQRPPESDYSPVCDQKQ